MYEFDERNPPVSTLCCHCWKKATVIHCLKRCWKKTTVVYRSAGKNPPSFNVFITIAAKIYDYSTFLPLLKKSTVFTVKSTIEEIYRFSPFLALLEKIHRYSPLLAWLEKNRPIFTVISTAGKNAQLFTVMSNAGKKSKRFSPFLAFLKKSTVIHR